MIRDKNIYLQAFKNKTSSTPSTALAPIWADQYQQYKQLLQKIKQSNSQIIRLLKQYESTSTVYYYQQINKQLTETDRDIRKVEIWAQTIATLETSPTQVKVMQNISKSVLQDLAVEKQRYNSSKLLFTTIDQASYNMPSMHNISMHSNASNLQQTILRQKKEKHATNLNIYNLMRREQEFDQASNNIAGINQIIARMGDQVHQQGGMVDRIDTHLSVAQNNMALGNKELRERLQAQRGQGETEGEESEWNISSKINKAMMFFYVLNIVLIIVWFVKHL